MNSPSYLSNFIRFVDQHDINNINALIGTLGGNSLFRANFGNFSLPNLVDFSSYFTVFDLTLDQEKNFSKEESSPIQAALSISDSVNFVSSGSFDNVIELFQNKLPVNINNTMFINFWASDHINNSSLSYAILFHFFAKNIHIDYVFWVCNTNFFPNDFIQDIFRSFTASDISPNKPVHSDIIDELSSYQILYVSRSSILPKLSVRNAVIEDHDDILPILQRHHPHLFSLEHNKSHADLNQNYFLANLINNQDENNSIHVALKNNIINGMISTSMDVNMSMLMKIFDINEYNGLLLPTNDVEIPPPLIINIMGELRILDIETVEEVLKANNCVFLNFETLKIKEILKKYDDNLSVSEKIDKYVQDKINETPAPEDIQAVVFWAFPSNEEDLQLYSHYLLNRVNISLELLNVSEDEDKNQDEELNDDDEVLQSHLDGMESFRELYLHAASMEKKCEWRKVYYDSETLKKNKYENLTHFKSIFFSCLDERLSKLEIARTLNKEKPPKSNAFAITTLCLTEESSSRSIDLVQYCFELHSTLDYCLYIVDNKSVPTDMLNCFSLVSKREDVSFDQNLYILHKSFFYMRDYMNIERISNNSESLIKDYLERYYASTINNNINKNKQTQLEIQQKVYLEMETISKYIDKCEQEKEVGLTENPVSVGFLMKLDDLVLGYVFLSREIFSNNSEEFNKLKKNFDFGSHVNLNRHKSRNIYSICFWKIEKNFIHFTPLFLKNLMRICDKSCLLFQICNRQQSINSLSVSPTFPQEFLYLFNFIKPRKFIDEEDDLSSNSIYYFKKSMISRQKSLISTRVVIIGGSVHSQSIIETFSSLNDIIYTNIFYLDEEVSSWGQCNGCLSPQDPDQISLREFYANDFKHRINIINGKLTDIDRENKAIIISDKMVLEYDYLIISSSTHDYSFKSVPSLSNIHPLKCADIGVFGLGNMTFDSLALNWINKKKDSKNDVITVIGVAAYVFHVVEILIKENGINPDKIVCILNESPYSLDLCCDSTISNGIKNSSNWSNVTEIYWNSTVSDVILNKSGFVQAVELNQIPIVKEDDSEEFFAVAPAKVNCGTIIFCNGAKNISCDRDMFAAINDCGLVFDGGLIVDTQFRTVDPCIFGVSDFSKFSRIYKNKIPHKNFNAKEIGTFVAINLLSKYLHPDILKANEIYSKNQILNTLGVSLIPNYRQKLVKNYLSQIKPLFTLPRSLIFHLSGNYSFFLSKLPQISPEVLHLPTENSYSNTSSIKNTNSFHNIACVSIEPLGEIEMLSIVSQDLYNKKAIPIYFLSSIVGKHESYFDSILHSYKQGLITDWLVYFNESWTKVMQSNEFNSLMNSIYKSLEMDKEVYQIVSRLFERVDPVPLMHNNSMMSSSVVYVNNDSDIEEIRRGMIGVHGQFISSSTRKVIQDNTIEYLKKYNDLTSSYKIPSNNNN